MAVTFTVSLLTALLLPAHQARAETAAPALRVSVTLAEPLHALTAPDDTLFVYARAPSGPRMPLAIVRLQASDLPAMVVLDDSTAMMPGMSLSAFDEVEVIARISRTGNAMTRSGDLMGNTPRVRVMESPQVAVVIETRVP